MLPLVNGTQHNVRPKCRILRNCWISYLHCNNFYINSSVASRTNLQPEGAACYNFVVQYALALVVKESFKVYCAINDGIINLVVMAYHLADFYDRTLDLAHIFPFPTLRQPPPSFLQLWRII